MLSRKFDRYVCFGPIEFLRDSVQVELPLNHLSVRGKQRVKTTFVLYERVPSFCLRSKRINEKYIDRTVERLKLEHRLDYHKPAIKWPQFDQDKQEIT
jgi:hypothetical protein